MDSEVQDNAHQLRWTAIFLNTILGEKLMRQNSYWLLGAFFCAVISSSTLGQSRADVFERCAKLADLDLLDTTVSAASLEPADQFAPPGEEVAFELPGFCRLEGVISPAIGFEVWLPIADWNGKLQLVVMVAWQVRSAIAPWVGRWFRLRDPRAQTRAIRQARTFDAMGIGRMDLIEDFGHRALHVTTERAKSVVRHSMPRRRNSYYVGCSKGGQQGLMEAQRYPDDFDGIIAGNPANDWTRFYAGGHLWYSLAMLEDEESWIPPAKLQALGEAVNSACDADDGIRDGILMNPLACDFPASLCEGDSDSNSCLTPKQVGAVERIWSGARNARGELIYPGLVPGGEAAPGGWSTWVTGAAPYQSLHWRGGEGFFRWFVFDDADWDFRSFDFDSDLDLAIETVGSAVDANDPDLSAFRDHGGKLLVYHGWSDPDISPLASIDYFSRVVDLAASEADVTSREQAESVTKDYFRLFMAPGMGHCAGGPGPDRFDALTALENWVEYDNPPDSIIARKIEGGQVTRSRPLCVYPAFARYNGSGSTDEAANFYCAVPE